MTPPSRADRLRTLLFRLTFWSLSVPILLIAPAIGLLGQRVMMRYATVWTGVHYLLARVILRVRVRWEGTRPAGPVLYAAKHQAMFETLELQRVLDGPAMVLKQELARIPFWGWAARRYGAIAVDRDASAQAMRTMLRAAAAAAARGRPILIFPEGTRVRPGEQPPLKPGFAGLYRTLGLPTIPIACDSGRLIPRKGPIRAGTITFRFGEPIPPGLPRRQAEARVHAAINVLDDPAANG